MHHPSQHDDPSPMADPNVAARGVNDPPTKHEGFLTDVTPPPAPQTELTTTPQPPAPPPAPQTELTTTPQPPAPPPPPPPAPQTELTTTPQPPTHAPPPPTHAPPPPTHAATPPAAESVTTASATEPGVETDLVVELREPAGLREPSEAGPEVKPEVEPALPDSTAEAEPPVDAQVGESDVAAAHHRSWRGVSAVTVSMVLHAAIFVVLAYWLLPSITRPDPPRMVMAPADASEQQLEQFELEALEPTSLETLDGSQALVGPNGLPAGIGEPAFEAGLSKKLALKPSKINIGLPLDGAPPTTQLIEEVPDGVRGDPRVIVDGYDDAFDQITREIQWMLSKSKVQITWCFDQSESMEDDQEEIRARIKRVYRELGLLRQQNDALTTSVTSYGKGFLAHSKRPTSDVREIEDAIDQVPTDPSGHEMMCQAVILSIQRQIEYVKKDSRQMAMVLVTDESGDPSSNIAGLEQAVELARATKCRIYILGREAVFGYPYAHMKWVHPWTKHVHWLPVDRGPETAFVQQLQTDGFRKRYDAHPSGFGPYEQCRLARETGGIFFMLPSLETKLVRGEKRRYELAAMRAYMPDLGRRDELLMKRDKSLLQSVLWKIINDLNPYKPEVAKVMEVSYRFSAKPDVFLSEVRREQVKARLYLEYLAGATKMIEEIRYHRDQEPDPRWQANYDLIYAQLLAYTARTYEYIAYLEKFIVQPKIVPLEKPNFRRLASWHINTSRETVGGEITASYIQRSSDMFQEVIRQHPGTPWAARAEKELTRGFGFELREHYGYYGPRPPTPPRPTPPKIPIPTL